MSTYITKRAKQLNLKKIDGGALLTLEVLASDVKEAKQRNSKCCAFACAAKRLPKVRAAYFFRSTAWLEYADKMVRYILPPSMQKEIVSFDRAKVMAPGVYRLSPPGDSNSMKAITARSKKRPGRHMPAAGKIKRRLRHETQLIRTLHEPANR